MLGFLLCVSNLLFVLVFASGMTIVFIYLLRHRHMNSSVYFFVIVAPHAS